MMKNLAVYLKTVLLLFAISKTQTVFANNTWAKERIKVDKNVSMGIEEVLEMTAELHKFRVNKDSVKTLELADALASKLGRVASLTQKRNSVQSLHITKIIQSAQSAIEMFKESPTTDKANLELRDFFKEIVQITQVFDVKKYKIFFCPQDKSLWLQTLPKASNPVSLNLKNCGKPI
jgi:hypothetical protein